MALGAQFCHKINVSEKTTKANASGDPKQDICGKSINLESNKIKPDKIEN